MRARTPSSSHNGTSAVYSGPHSQKFFSSQLAADAGLADTKVANASAKTASRARIAVPTPVVLVATVLGTLVVLGVALRIAHEVENATIVFVVCDRGDRYLSTGVFPA